MNVNRSGYYTYVKRQTNRRIDCGAAIKECFEVNRRRYGSRRIAASLKIGRSTVQKVMRREGMRAIQAFGGGSLPHQQAFGFEHYNQSQQFRVDDCFTHAARFGGGLGEVLTGAGLIQVQSGW